MLSEGVQGVRCWIGNAQVRFASLDDDLLRLSTKPMTFQGVERKAELVWERVGHD
jgi:hypothetical protein